MSFESSFLALKNERFCFWSKPFLSRGGTCNTWMNFDRDFPKLYTKLCTKIITPSFFIEMAQIWYHLKALCLLYKMSVFVF